MDRVAPPATLAPEPLEVAVGTVLGGPATPRRRRHRPQSPVAAVEGHLLTCLRRPPCGIAFSGGRDSSALLVLAAHLARRHGLAPPIALTEEHAHIPDTEERAWQELVLRTVPEVPWERVSLADELDIVGPVARRAFEGHGLLFPWNAYTQLPLIDAVAGGSLLTGVGGDEVMGSLAAHPVRVAARRASPGRSDVAYALRWFGPGRRAWLGTQVIDELAWVRPAALAEARSREGDWILSLGLRWDRAMRRWARSRYAVAMQASLGALGTDADVLVRSPFLEPDVVDAFADDLGWAGPVSRADVLAALCGPLLPGPTVHRRSKAVFTEAFFQEPSREARRAWTGGGVDGDLVDGEALARAWEAPVPDGRTGLLLQHVTFAP